MNSLFVYKQKGRCCNMGKLTAKKFMELCKTLPKEEQYRLSETLDPHEQFLLRTLYIIPEFIPTGETEKSTKEEREKAHQDLINIMKEYGIIKDESECEEID